MEVARGTALTPQQALYQQCEIYEEAVVNKEAYEETKMSGMGPVERHARLLKAEKAMAAHRDAYDKLFWLVKHNSTRTAPKTIPVCSRGR